MRERPDHEPWTCPICHRPLTIYPLTRNIRAGLERRASIGGNHALAMAINAIKYQLQGNTQKTRTEIPMGKGQITIQVSKGKPRGTMRG
jgi:hypothetical protein